MPIKHIAKLAPQTSALLICDIQERFKGMIWQYPSVISVANKMVKTSKLLDIPIAVTEQYSKAFGNTVNELDVSDANVCVQKTKFSMYLPEVVDELKKHNTKSILLLGIESHICVLQTCLDFLENDYDVHVIVDGISSQNYPEIDYSVARMKSAGATITTSDTVLFQLVEDSNHPKFKGVSAIVKEYMEATKANRLLFRDEHQ